MRSRVQKYSFLFCFLFYLLLSTLPVPAAFALDKVWCLEQTADLKPKTRVYVCEKAIRIDAAEPGYTILCKSPDWTVHCFRNDEKTEWFGSLPDFNAILLSNPYFEGGMKKQFKWQLVPDKQKNMTICGVDCQRYRTRGTLYVCSDKIKVQPQIVLFFNKLYSSPLLPSIPLYICANRMGTQPKRTKEPNWMDIDMATDLRGGKVVVLSTTKISSQPYREKDFALPQGYKRKKDLIEIGYSPKQRLQINELVDNVGYEGSVEKVEKLDKLNKEKKAKQK